MMKNCFIILLLTSISFWQSSIVAAGHNSYTIGEVMPLMQQVDTLIQVRLGVPKYEMPIEPKKPIVKKISWIEKIMEFIKRLFSDL